MTNGKIVLKGILRLTSPMLIGSGKNDETDRDVLLDSRGKAFIPATSFTGVLFGLLESEKHNKYLGIFDDRDKNKNQSFVICDDLFPVEESSACSIRDGIGIDPISGTVQKGAKFDYQIVEPGLSFALNMEFEVNSRYGLELAEELVGLTLYQLNQGLQVGGKTSSGFGNLEVEKLQIFKYDFDKSSDLAAYLLNKETIDLYSDYPQIPQSFENFMISADFRIPHSLIVRSYPQSAYGSDATHLKSNDDFVLPGSSLRGALRARARRILNTIWDDSEYDTNAMIESIFGYAKTDGDRKYTIPSSLRVSENKIINVETEMQNRVKIDRFTGGTIEGALFDSMPVFPKGDSEINIEGLKLELRKPLDSQKALLLLLLKDLYNGDLAIGGEKNIGRGTLVGSKASIFDEAKEVFTIEKTEDFKDMDSAEEYMHALLNKTDIEAIKSRLKVFKQRR